VASSVASEESDTSDEATDPGFVPLAMGLDQVCLTEIYRLKECAKHVDHVQDLVTTQGAIVSSNGQRKITVSEIQEHLIMPEYPATANEGILHFIHSKNPLQSQSREPQAIPDKELYDGFTDVISKVIIFWASGKSIKIHANPIRSNFPCITRANSMLPGFHCCQKKMTTMLGGRGTGHINAVEYRTVSMPMTL
jgi:hypothetical protein